MILFYKKNNHKLSHKNIYKIYTLFQKKVYIENSLQFKF
jgi:hypothetical protein